MKLIKPIYCSPKLEIVPFDDEDILTVSTHGNEGGSGNGSVNWGDLNWGDP